MFRVTIDDNAITCEPPLTILDVCRNNDISIPTLCYMEGLSTVGSCRLCLVEVEGSSRLLPACTTNVTEGQKIRTDTEQLKEYRRMTVELIFSERNHICSVCVANGDCELQDLAYSVGMTMVRFPYLYQECEIDTSHRLYNLDHNRCIMCTRCVRVCDEVEGAHTLDVTLRGFGARIITDFAQPWGDSDTCTSCGKCVQSCPVGALWPKRAVQGQLHKEPVKITELVDKRKYR